MKNKTNYQVDCSRVQNAFFADNWKTCLLGGLELLNSPNEGKDVFESGSSKYTAVANLNIIKIIFLMIKL